MHGGRAVATPACPCSSYGLNLFLFSALCIVAEMCENGILFIGCGPLMVKNDTLVTYSDGFSLGSIATQACDSMKGYVPMVTVPGADSRGAAADTSIRACELSGWSGSDITCES